MCDIINDHLQTFYIDISGQNHMCDIMAIFRLYIDISGQNHMCDIMAIFRLYIDISGQNHMHV